MTTTQSANGRRVEGIEKYFWAITRYPKLIIAVGFIGILAMAASLPALVKDTTRDAFIAKDNPAVVRSWPRAVLDRMLDPFDVHRINLTVVTH